jgi:hypothetical protein
MIPNLNQQITLSKSGHLVKWACSRKDGHFDGQNLKNGQMPIKIGILISE